jgi:hypothetical protein
VRASSNGSWRPACSLWNTVGAPAAAVGVPARAAAMPWVGPTASTIVNPRRTRRTTRSAVAETSPPGSSPRRARARGRSRADRERRPGLAADQARMPAGTSGSRKTQTRSSAGSGDGP